MVPSVQCPFCSMQGVQEHALPFQHGQALYACSMANHYTNLYSESALRSTMALFTNGAQASSSV